MREKIEKSNRRKKITGITFANNQEASLDVFRLLDLQANSSMLEVINHSGLLCFFVRPVGEALGKDTKGLKELSIILGIVSQKNKIMRAANSILSYPQRP